jgi:DNA polymerase elongation subunit (family B)
MKLFEATWRNGYEFIERYYDTELNKSFTSRINLPHEWYEPSSRGHYTSILDATIKVDKKQGRSNDAKGHYGVLDPMYRNIRDNYWNQGKYNIEPRIWYLDIETRVGQNSTGFPKPDKSLEQISLMQIYDNKEKVMYMLGLRDWKHFDQSKFDYTVKYVNCKNEINLIEAFLKIYKLLDPLVIYAWSGDGFDFPYIYNRLKRLGMDTNLLSNHGEVKLKDSLIKGMVTYNLVADGHFWVDQMKVYRKFIVKPVAAYNLETISNIELGEGKVSHTEYAKFDDFYTGNYIIPEDPTEDQKSSLIYQEAIKGNWEEVKELAHSEFCYYGAQDTYLIKRIDDKQNLTVLMLMIAEKMGVQVGDSMGTVKPWSQYIANKSMINKQVMPPRKEYDQPEIVGGHVREPAFGKHKWVLAGDVNSMYPLLGMVGFNMSPETFIPKYKLPEDLRDIVLSKFNNQDEGDRLELDDEIWDSVKQSLTNNQISLGINGAAFSHDKLGLIPELVMEIYNTRKQAKKTMFKYEQRKILISEIIKRKT